MKKKTILLSVAPILLAAASLTSCGGDGPKPTELKFTVTESQVAYDTNNKQAVVHLDWEPNGDILDFTNLTFSYDDGKTSAGAEVTGDLTARPRKVTITFNEDITANIVGNLNFNYTDNTTKETGKAQVKDINVLLPQPQTPLCFTALDDNSPILGCFAVAKEGEIPETLPTLYYCTGEQPSENPDDWHEFVLNDYEYSSQLKEGCQEIVTLDKGEKVYFVGSNPEGINGPKAGGDPEDATIYWHFGTAKHEQEKEHRFDISGNVMSLIDYPGRVEKVPNPYCFSYLFANRIYGGPQFVDASKVQLGDELVELSEGCYYHMFYNDQYLTKAPELPLPITGLADYCYQGMFCSCQNLIEAPKQLPAKQLAKGCYEMMFYNCFYKLATVPELPANNNGLAEDCYKNMFGGCHALAEIKVGFGTKNENKWPAPSGEEDDDSFYTEGWLSGVGTVTKDKKAHFVWVGNGAPAKRNINTVPGDTYDCTWSFN
ncbi:MAG: hypothetical protein MJ207_03875 [Bacilli bacterium]|nr:hypothetical protein [Bacilli bacterium]